MKPEADIQAEPGANPAAEVGGDVEPVGLDHWRLLFTDADIEQRYRRDHTRRVLPTIRLAFLCGTILFGFFGLLDFYLIVENLNTVLAMRFGIGCGTLLIAFGLTYTKLFDEYNQLIVSIAMLNCGLAIVAMTAIAGPPANEIYYAGLIMVIFYASILVHCRFIFTVAVTVTLVAAYFCGCHNGRAAALASDRGQFILPDHVARDEHLRLLRAGTRLASPVLTFLALQHASDVAIELKNEAVSANHAKTEFLATMSHELRTPLNAILGFSDIMKAGMYGPLGSSKYEDYAEDIHDSARHLLSIINDILDYSKTESGTVTLAENDINAAELTERSVRICNQIAASKGCASRRTSRRGPPIIRADRRLIQQALVNLLSNAIKFTPSAGEVKVSSSHSEAGGCRLIVSDTGIGIAPDDQVRVFEPFAQVQSAFARDQGGTGLGLPLVRKVAEMHGGTVELVSQVGEGTTVTIELPPSRSLGFAEFDRSAGFRISAGVLNQQLSPVSGHTASRLGQCFPYALRLRHLATARHIQHFVAVAVFNPPVCDELHGPVVAQPRIGHVTDNQCAARCQLPVEPAGKASGHRGPQVVDETYSVDQVLRLDLSGGHATTHDSDETLLQHAQISLPPLCRNCGHEPGISIFQCFEILVDQREVRLT